MTNSDQRPRPQYGEYATPEEQRAAIKAPHENPHHSAPAEHPSYSEAPVAPASHADAAPRPGTQSTEVQRPPVAGAFLRHPADRVITIALLVFGLYNVISAIVDRGNFADQINSAYHGMGLTGDYAVTSLTGIVADVIAILFLVLWVCAAVLSVWAVVRGRIAFWIPLVAGILASLVSGVGYLILFLHDPTFLAYVQHVG